MFARNKKAQEITISNRTIVRILFFIVLTGLIIRIFENMVHPLTLIFVSFFFYRRSVMVSFVQNSWL